MKIAAAQLNYIIGNFDYNFAKIEEAINKAKTQNADLIVFSELAVCGYPPRDFLEFDDFIKECENTLNKIKALSNGIGVIVGAPSKNPVIEGKDLFNSAYFFYNNETLHVAHKALLPTYDVFDEYRYFEPADEFKVAEFKGKKLAITICEDIWNVGNDNPMYETCPMDELIKQGPELMINLSASPFTYEKYEVRNNMLKANCARYNLPIIYVNHVGAQTELIFDGGTIVMDANGNTIDEMACFKEDFKVYDWEQLTKNSNDNYIVKDKNALIHDALVLGIKDYFGKLGFKKAILGMSGGIDSALTLALAAEALGAENVNAVMMPSQYSSEHSVSDSVKMINTLGCLSENIAIEPLYKTMITTLESQFAGTDENVTEENIQARMRAIILMALSNKFGYILLNTSNKSEAAVGYGTLYGDMCGGISVIGDLYKTQVYALSNYINERAGKEIIPQNIITKPPSAELRPDQKDSDSLPDYDILDEVLYQYIEKRQGPKELIAAGFDEALVKRILRLVNNSEYKRYQTPPMLRVSPKAFGMGRRMPIVGKYLG